MAVGEERTTLGYIHVYRHAFLLDLDLTSSGDMMLNGDGTPAGEENNKE